MSVRRAVTILVFAIVGIIAAFSAGGAQPASARDVIERFNDTLLKVMQEADTLGYSGRYEILAPAVRSSFDLGLMAQYAAGRHWKELSEAQQEGLTAGFARLTNAPYADRFKGYSGERLETPGKPEQRRGGKKGVR